jgi:hypothetical protein
MQNQSTYINGQLADLQSILSDKKPKECQIMFRCVMDFSYMWQTFGHKSERQCQLPAPTLLNQKAIKNSIFGARPERAEKKSVSLRRVKSVILTDALAKNF